MSVELVEDVDRLKRINQALMTRVESAMDQQGNAFSLFQTAINLDNQVRRRTDELTGALHRVEKVNQELEVAKEAAEQANLSKTRFLAAASHDVLQPLNAALLSVAVLSDLQTTEQGKALVGQIERTLDTMNELLSTLLDISRLDAGVVQPRREPIALAPLLESLESDFAAVAARKELRLRFVPCTLVVNSDKTMLRRILQNLVSNAIRYTTHGGVLIAVRQRGEACIVDVFDSGRGIPADQHDAIFEEFHRGALPASGTSDVDGGGLGLGLSIVKRMVAALGHDLQLTSREGRGTRFQLRLPVVENATAGIKVQPAVVNAAHGANLSGARILLIENDLGVVEAMTSLFDSWKCETVVASNQAETIASLNDTGWLPDAIVADQHLDHGDLGTLAVEAARNYCGRPVPAVIVTANPSRNLDSMARDAGIEVMQKPIKPAQLRALLSYLLAGGNALRSDIRSSQQTLFRV